MNTSRNDDKRSSAELVALALAAPDLDDELRWDCIGTLRFRGGEVEYELAVKLTKSLDAKERALGADILSQLGYTPDKFVHPIESVNILIELLSDPVDEVIWSAAHALGHRKDERSIPRLCELADHTNEDVRFGVACALGGFENDLAISTLIKLSSDVDSDVRDWATFGLGALLELDTPAIRQALYARATDEDNDTRGEALVGLAVRKDERTLELIRHELLRDDIGTLTLEAAQHLADESLLPLLFRQRETLEAGDDGYFVHCLEDAINACQSGNSSDVSWR